MPFKNKPFQITLFLLLILVSAPFYLNSSGRRSVSTDSLSKETANKFRISYNIDAQLLPEERKLLGSVTIRWMNRSKNPVTYLRFHLFYNAFQNEKTTLLKELEFFRKTKKELDFIQFGEIKIKEMRIIEGEELTHKMKNISPDDQNPHDQTVLEVKLKEPVKAFQTITIKVDYLLVIPQIIDKTGQADDYFFMSRWYPQIGVLEQDGSWNCHQYHQNTGFLSDFGSYLVAVTLPEKFIIGATGNLKKKTKNQDGTYTFVFQEDNIHSFVWVAYPHFKEIIEKVSLKGKQAETKIVMLVPPGHHKEKDRYLEAIKFSLNHYAEHIFPYPYKKITLLVPPYQARQSGDQSYPGLISVVSSNLIPRQLLWPERKIIHQFGQQYWKGILGPDTGREAWLDEGINAFFEMKLLEKLMGHSSNDAPLSWLGGLNRQYHRWKYLWRINVEKINQYSWKFMNPNTFRSTVLSKTALLLQSLSNHLGQRKIMDFFKFFAQRFAFQHPTTSDFIDNFNHFMGKDFSWLFEQFVNGNSNLDHSVYSIKSVVINRNPYRYRNEVVFLRDEGYFPVDLLVKLENGKEIKYHWKERENWKRIVWEDDSPLEYAAIDPEFKIPLDMNILNNSMRNRFSTEALTKITLKLAFYFQNLLGFLLL